MPERINGLWQRFVNWRRRDRRLVSFDGGFRLGDTDVHWVSVERAVAFKRDLLTVDCVCIIFELGESLVEIDEDMEGYAEVEAEMVAALALPKDWFAPVIQPPFATNHTQIFPRHC